MNMQRRVWLELQRSPAVSWPIGPDRVVVGKGPTSHIRVDSIGVSREHFVITSQGPTEPFLLADLHSAGGTWHSRNGSKPTQVKSETIELLDGDLILIGRCNFLFHDVWAPPRSI